MIPSISVLARNRQSHSSHLREWLTQNVISPPKGLIEEIQIPKGSCPFIYGWDGNDWTFITDGPWNAPLGLQFERANRSPIVTGSTFTSKEIESTQRWTLRDSNYGGALGGCLF